MRIIMKNDSNPNNVKMVHISVPASMPVSMAMAIPLPVPPSMGQTLEKKEQGEADISDSNTYTADSVDEPNDGLHETTDIKPNIENINSQEGTQAILLKRRLYTPFLQQFLAFDFGPKHCCIQIYLKLE